MKLENRKWEESYFEKEQNTVLAEWATGNEVDLRDAFNYHRSQPREKSAYYKLKKGQEEERVFLQPRGGVALLEEHIDLLHALEQKGGADFLPTTIDSYTRQNRYEDAARGIEESKAAGRSMLNGMPAVNYGVKNCRKIVNAVGVPVQVRHGTPDARLLAEITLASGFTDFEGGGISYNIPYAKSVPVEQSLLDWQYVDRLCGIYAENSIIINREMFGPLTGTLVPPCISHAIGIIEAILAAEQGVRSIAVGYGQGGNLIQDIAAMRSLSLLGKKYLDRFGYSDVFMTTVFHQWMGGFPQDENRAFGVISWGAATAALGRANKVIVKTPHEAVGIPTADANVAGLLCTRQVIRMLAEQSLPEIPVLQEEEAVIEHEVDEIMERVLDLGDGDLALGAVRSFKAGVLDVPFAPSRCVKGAIMPVRDRNGAIRFLQTGNLPFSKEIKEFHKEKIRERGREEKREPGFRMVIDDIYAISKGMLVGKPR
ncbi:MAG TPA: methylaspartate mutase subunit E [Syntrophomonadaceae bacterium]|nr:methylaspartate mutase subunit E [Syntrophomonadaceae bacterium]